MVALVKAQQTFGWTPPQIGPRVQSNPLLSLLFVRIHLSSGRALVPIPNQVGTGFWPRPC